MEKPHSSAPAAGTVRAAALLRVSTARQAALHRSEEETLPVQREAVRRFAAQHGWTLVREFAEEGVSAWKNSSADRPVLTELLEAGRQRQFDVLVVFKADRLSRQSLEYPVVLHTLRRFGISTWTVADGVTGRELSVDTPLERLMRNIEGFQSDSESANTSIRVTAAMRRMAEQGRWTGGPAPYGFRVAQASREDALPLEVHEDEAEVVREIYRLYLEQEVGSVTIARLLTDRGLRMRNGKPWHDTAVRAVLSSTMVAGRTIWGRHYRDPQTRQMRHRPLTDPQVLIAPTSVPAWTIVSWEDFERAQARRAAWQPRQHSDVQDRTRAESSALLLTGLMRCGACGGPITAGHAAPTKVLKDGTRVRYRYPRYICRNHYGGQPCAGQRTYSVRTLDQLVVSHVRAELAQMDTQEAYQALAERVQSGTFHQRQQVAAAQRRVDRGTRLQASWTQRLNAYLLDPEASPYDEAYLADRIADTRSELAAAQRDLQTLTRDGDDLEKRLAALNQFRQEAPTFGQEFLRWDRATQKRALRRLLERIVVSSEGLDIHWRIDLAGLGSETSRLDPVTWRSQVAYGTPS